MDMCDCCWVGFYVDIGLYCFGELFDIFVIDDVIDFGVGGVDCLFVVGGVVGIDFVEFDYELVGVLWCGECFGCFLCYVEY